MKKSKINPLPTTSPTGSELRALRTSRGLTQKQMAALACISLRGYQSCESGVNAMTPGHYTLLRLLLRDLPLDAVALPESVTQVN